MAGYFVNRFTWSCQSPQTAVVMAVNNERLMKANCFGRFLVLKNFLIKPMIMGMVLSPSCTSNSKKFYGILLWLMVISKVYLYSCPRANCVCFRQTCPA